MRRLLITGGEDPLFSGERLAGGELSGPLTHENCLALQARFPWTAPSCPRGKRITFGLGDRLGIAAPAQLAALAGTEVFPVLAQQSSRELKLTHRSNREMLDDVAWEVFQAGYQGGYAADGDHLKTEEEVRRALADGDTMITLDCSDYIDTAAYRLHEEDAWARCRALFPEKTLETWTRTYCGKQFARPGVTVTFPQEGFAQLLLTYARAVQFAAQIWQNLILPVRDTVAFELSIDETEIPTSPCAHYFVAAELQAAQVTLDSLAPRFCGEFQKGIDYIGQTADFERDFSAHTAIAAAFGYRISVHSGSDKFRIFQIVGRCPEGYHLKTSGTSWVEAVRVIAMCEPALFRRMWACACTYFEQARAYYHVSAALADAPEVPALPDDPCPRQILYITYGFLLAKQEDGEPTLRADIYAALRRHEAVFRQIITAHIRRHLTALGLCETPQQ